MSPPQFEAQLDEYEQRLTALLEVAEILSGVLDIDVLVKTIMERACSLLNAERCSLFLVDSNHQELITKFHGGLDKDIRAIRFLIYLSNHIFFIDRKSVV